ncbi:MAG: endonuclease/exonuclease/phosphatase family protein, partial [Polyangiaceae bacterium]|nr:endonuclease/exonuclease/phosphatase family protein [Polyangiaceae bacterium]
MQVRVVSWNIHKGIGGVDRSYQLGRVAEVLSSLNADFLLLQEVADGWPGAKEELQAEKLATDLGYPHLLFHREHRFKKGGYGNAILSKHHLTREAHIDLT